MTYTLSVATRIGGGDVLAMVSMLGRLDVELLELDREVVTMALTRKCCTNTSAFFYRLIRHQTKRVDRMDTAQVEGRMWGTAYSLNPSERPEGPGGGEIQRQLCISCCSCFSSLFVSPGSSERLSLSSLSSVNLRIPLRQ